MKIFKSNDHKYDAVWLGRIHSLKDGGEGENRTLEIKLTSFHSLFKFNRISIKWLLICIALSRDVKEKISA